MKQQYINAAYRMPAFEELGMQAASGALGGIMGIALGAHQDKRQYNQAARMQHLQTEGMKKMTDYNMMKQLEMWEKTGYGAQKKQMMEAGLNPALMYGMGGGGGQSSNINTGNVGAGGGPNTGGEAQAMMGMGLQMNMQRAQVELMQAQARNLDADTANKPKTGENIGADTALKGLQGEVLKTQNEIQKLDMKMNTETYFSRLNEIVSRSIEQQEKGVIAGVQREIAEETINENITKIKEEAIGAGLQNAATRAGIALTQEQTRKIGQDILQKWAELNINKAANEWEHHDRLKAIEEYTENALKVAGIMAAGNIVRDVLGVATRGKAITSKSTSTTGPKGVTVTQTDYNR